MIIEINAITAAEARELTNIYKAHEQFLNTVIEAPLTIICAKIIEKYLMPSIKACAKRGETKATFTVAKSKNYCAGFDDFIKTINETTTYYFDIYGSLKAADESVYITTDEIIAQIERLMNKIGYTFEHGYDYSRGYWKDYDLIIKW